MINFKNPKERDVVDVAESGNRDKKEKKNLEQSMTKREKEKRRHPIPRDDFL